MWYDLARFMHLLGLGTALGAGLSQAQLLRDAGKGGHDALFFVVAARSIRVKIESPSLILLTSSALAMTMLADAPPFRHGALRAGVLLVYLLVHFICGRRLRKLHREFVDGESDWRRKHARRLAWLIMIGLSLPAALLLALNDGMGLNGPEKSPMETSK